MRSVREPAAGGPPPALSRGPLAASSSWGSSQSPTPGTPAGPPAPRAARAPGPARTPRSSRKPPAAPGRSAEARGTHSQTGGGAPGPPQHAGRRPGAPPPPAPVRPRARLARPGGGRARGGGGGPWRAGGLPGLPAFAAGGGRGACGVGGAGALLGGDRGRGLAVLPVAAAAAGLAAPAVRGIPGRGEGRGGGAAPAARCRLGLDSPAPGPQPLAPGRRGPRRDLSTAALARRAPGSDARRHGGLPVRVPEPCAEPPPPPAHGRGATPRGPSAASRRGSPAPGVCRGAPRAAHRRRGPGQRGLRSSRPSVTGGAPAGSPSGGTGPAHGRAGRAERREGERGRGARPVFFGLLGGLPEEEEARGTPQRRKPPPAAPAAPGRALWSRSAAAAAECRGQPPPEPAPRPRRQPGSRGLRGGRCRWRGRGGVCTPPRREAPSRNALSGDPPGGGCSIRWRDPSLREFFFRRAERSPGAEARCPRSRGGK